MTPTRPWRLPETERTFHLVGDVQGIPYLGSKTTRADATIEDMARPTIPTVAHRIQVGDFVSSGPATNFPPTVNFMDALGDEQWFATVGNHDHDRPAIDDPENVRTADEAAVLMGMPAANYVEDLGYAVLISFYVRAWQRTDDVAPDTTWLADQLDTYPDRVCMIVAHPPFLNGTRLPTNAPLMLSADDIAIKAVIDARPQAKIWLCGHTHSPLIHPVATTLSTGSRNLIQINGSALLNVAPGDTQDAWDPIRSLFVTVNETTVDVRFRDHGNHQWIGGGPTSTPVQTLPLPA